MQKRVWYRRRLRIEALEDRRLLAAGDPDLTFDSDGKQTSNRFFDATDRNELARGVAVQSDGKVVIGGTSSNGTNNDFALARYNVDGSLDTSFGGDGKVMTKVGTYDDEIYGVAIQPDGKIVAAGRSWNGSNYDVALVRYLADGSLDTSFNATGKVTTDLFGLNLDNEAFGIGLQTNGGTTNIVVAGRTADDATHYDIFLARYFASGAQAGQRDTTFNNSINGGISIAESFNGGEDQDEQGFSLAVGMDNSIVAAGTAFSTESNSYDFAVARFSSAGELDTSFDGDGKAFTNFGGTSQDEAFGVAITPFGKIVAVGRTRATAADSWRFAVANYTPDGSTDPKASGGGMFTTDFGAGGAQAFSVVVQPGNEYIVVAGESNGDFALARYDRAGALDTIFSGDGKLTTSFGSGQDTAYGVALAPDGKVVAAGITTVAAGNSDVAVARYAAGVPEIWVEGEGNEVVVDGDGSPRLVDGTDYGNVAVGGGPRNRTFTIHNSGEGVLTLSGLTVPSGFTVVDGLATGVNPGQTDTIVVQLATGTAGTKTGSISLTTNDASENPFNFAIQGEVVSTPTPEVAVVGNTLIIADEDTTPNTLDLTHFGTVAQGTTPVDHTFTVRNDGSATLTLSAVTVPTGFTVVSPSPSIPAGGSSTFSIRMQTTTVGSKAGDFSFATNVSGMNPYNFRISGVVGVAEITVLAGAVNITDGDATPSATELTDFGTVALGGATVTHTFTIRNDGNAVLTFGAFVAPAGFAVTPPTGSTVSAGATKTFTVRLDTATPGVKSGDVSFTNSDSNESPFNFRITGTIPSVGDYDLSHAVDAADFVLWRKTFGTTAPNYTGADGNGNGTVDPLDYNVWRSHFGQSVPGAGSGGDAVASSETDTAPAEPVAPEERMQAVVALGDSGRDSSGARATRRNFGRVSAGEEIRRDDVLLAWLDTGGRGRNKSFGEFDMANDDALSQDGIDGSCDALDLAFAGVAAETL